MGLYLVARQVTSLAEEPPLPSDPRHVPIVAVRVCSFSIGNTDTRPSLPRLAPAAHPAYLTLAASSGAYHSQPTPHPRTCTGQHPPRRRARAPLAPAGDACAAATEGCCASPPTRPSNERSVKQRPPPWPPSPLAPWPWTPASARPRRQSRRTWPAQGGRSPPRPTPRC